MAHGRGRGRFRGRVANPAAQVPFFLADFTQLAAGAVATLPGGLLLTRASAATVQTGTSTVVTAGITTDVARVGRRLDADSPGLVIEPARTNLVGDSRNIAGATWFVGQGSATHPGTPVGPDGASLTSREVLSAGQYGQIRTGQAWTGAATMSAWLRTTSGSAGNGQLYVYDGGTYALLLPTLSGSWLRYSVTRNAGSGGGGQLSPCDARSLGAGAPGALDNLLDLMQGEQGAWPSEPIVTTGASATRAGERLYLPTSSPYVVGGRLSLAVSLRPKSTLANADSAQRLWTSGADYAEIATTGVLTVSIGGVTNTTAALTWAQYDTVDLWVAAGGSSATLVSYRVNGGATSHPAVTGSALGNVSTAGALDLLNDGASPPLKQFSAWVTSITFYRGGAAPSWK